MPKLKKIPRFKSEEAERRFWATHDSAQYVDYSGARRFAFENLHPSTRSISLRLPEPMLARLKELAHKRDVPYQTLLKILLAERLDQEWRQSPAAGALASELRDRR